MTRMVFFGSVLSIVIAACGGSLSADDYVKELNAIASEANELFEPAVASYNETANPTITDDVAFLEAEISIRRQTHDPLAALEPPTALADIHALLIGMSIRQLAAAEGLLPVAHGARSIGELHGTPELAEYEAANGSGSQICTDVQKKLDELADREDAFEDTPWISAELILAVRGALGCGDIQKK